MTNPPSDQLTPRTSDALMAPVSPAADNTGSPGQALAREANIHAFLAQQGQWDGAWATLSSSQRADCVRALLRDYLADFGNNEDWESVMLQALRVLASLFDQSYPLMKDDQPTPLMEVELNPSSRDTTGSTGEDRSDGEDQSDGEGFRLHLRRVQLPPNPVPSQGAWSQARVDFQFDASALPDQAINLCIERIAERTGQADRGPLMMTAAMLACWRAAQALAIVRGGHVYHGMSYDSLPDRPKTSVVVMFERTGHRCYRALNRADDGGSVMLLH